MLVFPQSNIVCVLKVTPGTDQLLQASPTYWHLYTDLHYMVEEIDQISADKVDGKSMMVFKFQRNSTTTDGFVFVCLYGGKSEVQGRDSGHAGIIKHSRMAEGRH